ncbi:hypothetical protein KM043_014296 [Ampulex compressa]|nr:hypothetical protein KM043_014296 [Ampulex compressa]
MISTRCALHFLGPPARGCRERSRLARGWRGEWGEGKEVEREPFRLTRNPNGNPPPVRNKEGLGGRQGGRDSCDDDYQDSLEEHRESVARVLESRGLSVARSKRSSAEEKEETSRAAGTSERTGDNHPAVRVIWPTSLQPNTSPRRVATNFAPRERRHDRFEAAERERRASNRRNEKGRREGVKADQRKGEETDGKTEEDAEAKVESAKVEEDDEELEESKAGH